MYKNAFYVSYNAETFKSTRIASKVEMILNL